MRAPPATSVAQTLTTVAPITLASDRAAFDAQILLTERATIRRSSVLGELLTWMFGDVKDALKIANDPYPAQMMKATQIGPDVGKVKNDYPALLESV